MRRALINCAIAAAPINISHFQFAQPRRNLLPRPSVFLLLRPLCEERKKRRRENLFGSDRLEGSACYGGGVRTPPPSLLLLPFTASPFAFKAGTCSSNMGVDLNLAPCDQWFHVCSKVFHLQIMAEMASRIFRF